MQRAITPRRYYQRGTHEAAGLLKDRIEAPGGTNVYVHLSEGIHSYCRPRQQTKVLFHWSDSEIEVDLVDSEFTKRLFAHLRKTHDFDLFRQWIAEVVRKQASLLDTINTQLAEIDRQQEAILDQQLALRAHINQQIREATAGDETADVEELKTRFEKEAAGEFERLRRRSLKLDNMEKELRAKLPTAEENEEARTARKFADFQTELEKLAEVWHLKPFKEKKEFVNLLVRKAVLSVVSTHWIRLDIHWTHPAWPHEALFIYRRKGEHNTWTDEEREVVKAHYEHAERDTLLQLLPDKSWNAIKKIAYQIRLQRPHQAASLLVPELATWTDYQFTRQAGIEPAARDTICVILSCPPVTVSGSPEDTAGQVLTPGDRSDKTLQSVIRTLDDLSRRLRLLFMKYHVA